MIPARNRIANQSGCAAAAGNPVLIGYRLSRDVLRALVSAVAICALLPAALWSQTDAQRSGTASDALIVQPIPDLRTDFIAGADISMLAQIEEVGGKYFDSNGAEKDLLRILKEKGVNWIRLRLWNNPVNPLPVLEGGRVISNKGQRAGGGNNDIARTIALAKRAKALGFKVLLDFHYSDFWTDPGKQNKPEAWKNLSFEQLKKELAAFTQSTLTRMDREGARPDMVQIGNELNNGMLWPEGKIWKGAGDTTVGGMDNFVALLKTASQAVRAADRGTPAMRIAIHLANGGDNALYRTVFDAVSAAGVDFDIIGLSFYTYWHGPIEDLKANLADLSTRYKKDLVVMETAYAFTTDDGDSFGNVFQVFNGPNGGYLPTVQGQATAVRDVMATVAGAPQNRGLGVFYWEPGWIPVAGAGWRTGEGDAWENQAMFDFRGRALPSLDVFSGVRTPPRTGASIAATTPKSAETVKLQRTVGDPLNLPMRVKTVLADDSWVWKDAEWESPLPPSPVEDRVLVVTGRVAGTTIPVRAELGFTKKRNLIADPSFESGKLEGWMVEDGLAASRVENNAANAHDGSYTFKYWLDKDFTVVLRKTFTGLTPGKYRFAFQAMGGGGEKSIRMFAVPGVGGPTYSPLSAETPGVAGQTVVNTGWKKWKLYELAGIEVTDGSCTVGIVIDAKSGNWGNFDEFEFYRESP